MFRGYLNTQTCVLDPNYASCYAHTRNASPCMTCTHAFPFLFIGSTTLSRACVVVFMFQLPRVPALTYFAHNRKETQAQIIARLQSENKVDLQIEFKKYQEKKTCPRNFSTQAWEKHKSDPTAAPLHFATQDDFANFGGFVLNIQYARLSDDNLRVQRQSRRF